MARYIDLQGSGQSLGRFELPEYITSDQRKIFRIHRAVRGGGNGIVFEGNVMHDFKKTGPICAVKFLRQQDSSKQDRFANEIRIMKELDSAHIARYHDSGHIGVSKVDDQKIVQQVPWMAMELGGDNLRQRVEAKGVIGLEDLKQHIDHICQAVSHLHSKGYIHRDIKPENFVFDLNEESSIKMIDFGIAKRFDEDVSARPLDNFTKFMEFVGPVFFSSPELIAYAANKEYPVDHRSDLFQIGKLVWYLATGKISAGVPSKRDCPYGGRLRDVVLELIADNPLDRIKKAEDIVSAINSI